MLKKIAIMLVVFHTTTPNPFLEVVTDDYSDTVKVIDRSTGLPVYEGRQIEGTDRVFGFRHDFQMNQREETGDYDLWKF